MTFGAKANTIIEEIMFSCKVDFFSTLPFTWNLIYPRICFVRANWPMGLTRKPILRDLDWRVLPNEEELGLQEEISFSTPRRSLVPLQKAVFFEHVKLLD